MKGQIFKIHSDFYYVNFNGEIYECKVREILKKQKEKILVGDFVEFEKQNTTQKTAIINEIYPRTNFLTRPSVANIEQVIIISSIKEPDLDFEQLNRYICLAKYNNLKTKLCFNKNDLSEDDSIIEKVFEIYEPLGFEIVFTSALEKLGIEDFAELIGDKLTVFCGNSGVGKSSLINSIAPKANLRTKNISEKTERGVHTTRHCEIIETKYDDTTIRIIDTPGFSHLKFDFLLPAEVDNLFDEIKQLNSACKYADCLHIREDGCNVLANIENIDISRYQSYVNFVNEALEYKEKIKTQGHKEENNHKKNLNKKLVKISMKNREASRNNTKSQVYKDLEDE